MSCFKPLLRTSAQFMRKIKTRCPVLLYWAIEKLFSLSAASVWGWCLNRDLGLDLFSELDRAVIKTGEGPTSGAASFFPLLHHEGQAAPVRPWWRGWLGVCNTINLHLDSARYFSLCQFSPFVELPQIQTLFLRSHHSCCSWFMSHDGRTDKESKWK